MSLTTSNTINITGNNITGTVTNTTTGYTYTTDATVNTIFTGIAYSLKEESNEEQKKDRKMKEKDGFIYIGDMKIMPSVKDINIIWNYDNMIGIKVLFSDDTVEKAVCDKEDTFNYDFGVAICLMKKLFSYMSKDKEFTGTYYFNKIMDLAFRNNSKTFEEKVKADKEKEKEKRRREKNRLRKEKQKNAKREAAIEIQKEAYVRAMKELKEDN